jgi:hypothetical protein
VAGQPARQPRGRRDGASARCRARTARSCRRSSGGRVAKRLRTRLTAPIDGNTGRLWQIARDSPERQLCPTALSLRQFPPVRQISIYVVFDRAIAFTRRLQSSQFFCSVEAPFSCPGHPSPEQRAQPRSRLGAPAPTAQRLGLDRGERGVTLKWSGGSWPSRVMVRPSR